METERWGMSSQTSGSSKNPKADAYYDSDDLAGNRQVCCRPVRAGPPTGCGAARTWRMPRFPSVRMSPVYHLGHHRRYKINVMDLRDYVFDKTLAARLILPEVTKDLVDVLVSQGRVSFEDIVEGKGSGVCVLLGGPPGVGKTLTAEVFAEATERPLLSVQAAQLGVSANDIERQPEGHPSEGQPLERGRPAR